MMGWTFVVVGIARDYYETNGTYVRFEVDLIL
jgi:hypothetical protein